MAFDNLIFKNVEISHHALWQESEPVKWQPYTDNEMWEFDAQVTPIEFSPDVPIVYWGTIYMPDNHRAIKETSEIQIGEFPTSVNGEVIIAKEYNTTDITKPVRNVPCGDGNVCRKCLVFKFHQSIIDEFRIERSDDILVITEVVVRRYWTSNKSGITLVVTGARQAI